MVQEILLQSNERKRQIVSAQKSGSADQGGQNVSSFHQEQQDGSESAVEANEANEMDAESK